MTRPRYCRRIFAIELYINSPDALAKAHQLFGGPQALLRSAAQCVADAGTDYDGASAGQSSNDEIGALICFAMEAGILLVAQAVSERLNANPMRPGKEHRVALLPDEGRVIKDADVHALATESLYDYLTDLLFSNYYFSDDIQVVGCYQASGRLHVVTTQPYVDGHHPDWPKLRTGLSFLGLRDPYPRSEMGMFIIDDERIGEVDVYDLHPNNVICDAAGLMNPIDAHFYFSDRAARTTALRALGLDKISGMTPLAKELASGRQ